MKSRRTKAVTGNTNSQTVSFVGNKTVTSFNRQKSPPDKNTVKLDYTRRKLSAQTTLLSLTDSKQVIQADLK